ncbi:zinc finger BED domain-containing protein 1-like [Sphaeramia orbicularis]|uniref:zinc finger BED domain-containing protein 1-like n=1 Tax=Sphaeramia orbicularis TaxID=375764 RepID=UPI001181555C|nr:zinc finger BED domain-containing protein 1-like [Sphaeramia orbicularis]
MCKVCRSKVKMKSSSTTNLFQHLRQRHPKEWEECSQLRECSVASTSHGKHAAKKQQTLAASFSCAVPYDKSGAQWKQMTEAVAVYLGMDMVPIYTVEKPGFLHMLKVWDPKYHPPSHKYFAEVAIPKLYNETRQALCEKLDTVLFFSTTTDLWSSRSLQPYLSLTVHYIDGNWSLNSCSLQTTYFSEDHTGELIAQGLKDSLAHWKLDEEKMVCMTTDSGTNMIKALKLNQWTHLSCFGHRLHNAIGNACKDAHIECAVGVCKKVISAFSFSWKKRRDLTVVQAELGLPEHQLISESPTRWGSRQQMIERVLEQEKAIGQILGADKKTRHLVPTWQDIDILESVNKAIKPLHDFTDALSGETYVSVSFIKPTLHLFNNSLLKSEEDDTELTRQIKSDVLKYLNQKYSDSATQDLIDLASLLDPRFRTTYIEPDKIEKLRERAIAELCSMHYRGIQDTHAADKDTSETESQVVELPAKMKKSLSSFFKKSPVEAETKTFDAKVKGEMSAYLLAPETDADSNPLKWWKLHETHFPRLSKLAKKYLSIPATSAPSERVFSTGGNIVTCTRACLKPKSVDKLVFLARNLRV